MMVVPTNFMPRLVKSFEMESERDERVWCNSWMTWFWVKLQM